MVRVESLRPQVERASAIAKTAWSFGLPRHVECFTSYRALPERVLYQWVSTIASSIRQNKDHHHVLDVGCGVGRFTIPLAKHLLTTSVTVHAVDPEPAVILALKGRAPYLDNLSVMTCDLLDITAPQFDVIFVSEVLHLVPDVGELLLHVRSLMPPTGGRLIIRAPSHAQIRNIEWLTYFPDLLELDLRRTIDIGPLADMVRSAGFHLSEIAVVDESRIMSREKYLAMLRERAFSILYAVEPSTLGKGLRAIASDLGDRDWVNQHSKMTKVVATSTSSLDVRAGARSA